ncbi:MAG TPA: protein-glutamate O-methyltransferase CheR [Polyangiaceae bacterium]|nr:protein-glutamate O-methyltransferase CheR [Polyangiaceae bacterium]
MSVAPAAFDRIRSLVKERSAIVLDEGKEYLVEARLTPIAKARGIGSLEQLASMLDAAHAELVDEVVQAMTTNETSFFRDVYPFEALREHVIPQLVSKRKSARTLRIWCAACSSGQEPYTIAMLLKENFANLADWDVSILATDLSHAMVERAKAGNYRQLEVNRGLGSQQLLRHFERNGLDWQIKPDIRRMVTFAPMNLVAPWPATPTFDIVFLRNVLIYFDVETKRRILGNLRGRMAGDGYLFLGGAETTMNIDISFERAPFERASCYRLTGS